MSRFKLTFLLVFVVSTLFVGNASAMQSNSPSSATTWKSLNTEQKQALAALSNEWDAMDEVKQKKWLAIAHKYSSMSPDEKLRVQERVNAWVKLTPAQRSEVRENYSKTTQITPEKKSEQWQQYQQLSDEEKKQLANEAKSKKNSTPIHTDSKRKESSTLPSKKTPASSEKSASIP